MQRVLLEGWHWPSPVGSRAGHVADPPALSLCMSGAHGSHRLYGHHGYFSSWALSTDTLAVSVDLLNQSSVHLLWFLLEKLTLRFENNSSELDVYMCLKTPLPLVWKRISLFSYNCNNSWKQGSFREVMWQAGVLESPASGTGLSRSWLRIWSKAVSPPEPLGRPAPHPIYPILVTIQMCLII